MIDCATISVSVVAETLAPERGATAKHLRERTGIHRVNEPVLVAAPGA